LHPLLAHLQTPQDHVRKQWEASRFRREPATKTASARFLSRLDVSSKAGRSRDQ
jgi:hypothetical protein